MTLPLVLPAWIPTEGIGPTPPPPPTPAQPTVVTAAVNADCAPRLPGDVPAIEITVTNNGNFNLVGTQDASFESGTGSAVPTNCTISSSTDQALDGSYSLKLVCLATAPGAMSVRLGPYPVQADFEYTVTANVRGGTARSIEIVPEFYAGDSFLANGATITQEDSDSAWWSPAPFAQATSPEMADAMYLSVTVIGALGPLTPPVGLTVTPTGTTGSTIYGYVITATDAYGETTPSATATTTTANATLSGSNYNALAWTADAGAADYNIYRGDPADCGELTSYFANVAAMWTEVATCAELIDYVGFFEFVATVSTPSYHDTNPGPLAPPYPPGSNTTGEPAYIDEVGIMPGDVDEWTITPPGSVVILRSDGTYVLGASPLFPLSFGGGRVVTILDPTAAYGLPVTYVALLMAGSTVSPPSIPSVPLSMGQAPDTCALYERLGWAKDQDATGTLLGWLAGIGQMMQAVDSISADSYDSDGAVAPSWSSVLDITRAPTAVLPWLGQFVGVRVDPMARDDQQRYAIESEAGFNRGTPAAILAAADKYLLPGYAASIVERDTSPYHLSVDIPSAGVTGPSTCLALYLSIPTCTAVYVDYATCADLWDSIVPIQSSVLAAIPAGLVADVVFV